MDSKLKSQSFSAKLAYVLISLMAVVYIAILAKDVIAPLIFSFLIFVLLLPFANYLEIKLKFPRGVAALFAVVLLSLIVLLVFYLVVSQATGLINDWPIFEKQLHNSLVIVQDWIADKFNIDKSHQLDYINSATSKLLNTSTEILGATVLSVSSLMIFLTFTFIFTFFFLLYRRLIVNFLIAVFPDKHTHIVKDVIQQTQYIIRKYIVGLMFQMGVIATVSTISFYLLGIKYSLLLGLITGIFNIVPYVGILMALFISSFVAFATAASLTKILLVVLVIVIIHVLDSNVLLPFVVGAKVEINALITVLGVIIGGMIWGVSGMFLSIPILAILKIIFDRVDSLKPWGLLLGEEEKLKK